MRSPVWVVSLLSIASVCAAQAPASGIPLDKALLDSAYRHAAELPKLRSLLVSQNGTLVRERYFHGASREQPADLKSASKSVLSALIGIAIQRHEIPGVKQPIAPFFKGDIPAKHDQRLDWITIEDLLTMRSGLQTTSFDNYDRWVSSRNWVRWALTQPMVTDPGREMDYSTGNSHLLSAILTKATKSTTFDFANRYLATPLGISIWPWQRDPQGIYFGGNEMFMTPRGMVAFGNLYLRRGRTTDGKQVVPEAWVDSSFVVRTRSGWSNLDYGYGWWSRSMAGEEVHFAWGYGGQYIFIVPRLQLTVVTTSDPKPEQRGDSHLDAIHALVERYIIRAALSRDHASRE
jgi:CubicO group peptidase (beta-lactamase class C family)